MVKAPENSRLFESLVKVVEALRGPSGCPWDKEQTHETLTRYAIEETYEYVEAVESGDDHEMCSELGDVLLQVVLNAEIAKQRGAFNIEDVVESICKKMVSRHPHVFESEGHSAHLTDKGLSSDEVVQNWQQLKGQEKGNKPEKKDFGLARGLPALLTAQKIGEKTAHMNFDWSSADAVVEKVREELDEVLEEMELASSSPGTNGHSQKVLNKKTQTNLSKELGDLLFSVVQLCRHLNVDSEQALRRTNLRFERRFFMARELCLQSGHDWMSLSESERESFWRQAKNLVE